MQIELITDILNKTINNIRFKSDIKLKGKFIVQRNLGQMNPPVFKKFTVRLYYAPIGKEENPKVILGLQEIIKCKTDDIEIIWDKICDEFLYSIFDYITLKNEEFKEIIYGNISRDK